MTFAPEKLELAIARVEALGDPNARDAAREAITAVLDFHREAVRRLSGRVREASADGESILRAAAKDEVVASLLSLHSVHPLSIESRVRPNVERVEVLDVDPDLIPVERLVGKRGGTHERCDLCGDELPSEHAHLFDVEQRRLTCACASCGVLFHSNAKNLRPVRRKALRLNDFRITDAQWAALRVPVGLAFFSRSSALGAVVAAYPGPAGAVESTVPPTAWESLVRDNAALAALDADTAALLVHRQRAMSRYYVLSIDECYRLTGLVRSRWQGLTGGDGPAQAIEEFFSALEEDRP